MGELPKFFLGLSILWAYALLTGLSPSVMRAAIMFSMLATAGLVKQKYSSLNILFVSAAFQMIIEPMVIFNIGFQLSYAAVGSILIFYQPIRDIFYFRHKAVRLLWETIALTLSAQIITTPISLYWFGQFPVWFIFSNLVLVPLSSLALIVGLVAFALDWLPYISDLAFHLFVFSIKLMDSLAAFFAALPYALLYFKMGLWDSFLLYTLIVGISLFFIKKKVFWFKFSLIVICCFLTTSIFYELAVKPENKWVVYALKQGTVIRHVVGYDVEEFRSDQVDRKTYSYSVKPSDKMYSVRNQTDISAENGFMQFDGKRIVLLDKQHISAELDAPIVCDWIILDSFKFIDFNKLQHNFTFDKLILSGGNSRKSKEFWKKECIKRNIPFYDVMESGAMIAVE